MNTLAEIGSPILDSKQYQVVTLDLQEFGLVTFETRLNKQGSPTEFSVLNEHQTTFF